MRLALHACAHDEQRACGAGCEALRGEQGDGGGAAGGDGGAVKNGDALAGSYIEHDHIALNGGAALVCVCRREADQLGDGDAAICGGHHKKRSAASQGLHDALGHMGTTIQQHSLDLLRQSGIRQAGGGLQSIQDHF